MGPSNGLDCPGGCGLSVSCRPLSPGLWRWRELDARGWDRNPPPPDLPLEVIERTRAGYLDAHERLVGSPFEE